MGDTTVAANLPLDEGTLLRVTHFGSDGQLVSEEETPYAPPYSAELARPELLIIVEPGE